MSGAEKARSNTEKAKGKLKDAAGTVSGNERLKDEGRAQQAKGHAREAKEDLKDAGRSVARGLRGDDPDPAHPRRRRGV